MILALVRKELRGMLPLVALAALVQLVLLICAMGLLPRPINIFGDTRVMPFYSIVESADVALWMILVGAGLGVLLGLWQSLAELIRGTFHFLLHRPLRRTTIFAVKLMVGGSVCLLVTVIPLFCYALWAATPGSYPGPFEWSMTATAWVLCVGVLLVYLATFLSGLRPARWYASRFLPVVLAGWIVFLMGVLPVGWIVALSTLVVTGACYVVAIFYVAGTRDFS